MKLLLVEDNAGDADFLRASLRRHQIGELELVHVDCLAAAVEALKKRSFDVVLLDLNLPDASGLECVDAMLAADEALPIVVLSGRDDEEFAVSILNKGVQDYLVKWEGEGRAILRSIRYAIERKRSEMHLNYLVQFDTLTEIPNRKYFNDQLEKATARARREGRKVALFFLDLDQFKVINDTLGHEAGDQLLKDVAARLQNAVRAGDVIARLGGDEFAVLVEGLNGALDAETIAHQLVEVISQPFEIGGREVTVTVSVGITLYPTDNAETTVLLKNADIAMYQAKDSGRNNFKFFTERMHEELMEYHQLEQDIKDTLEQDSFRLVYQPKVNLVTRRLQGLEALLRWDCPKRGAVSPVDFIPVAEESGHIIPLGYWVLQEVCRSIREWMDQGLPMVPISVNVSARQFQQANFHVRVSEILNEFCIDRGLIELELTEGLLVEDMESAQVCLQRLKDIGVRISIDDFGTGHSCLNYLRRFPIDVLKIDKSFVNDLGSGEDSTIIIEAIISLARSLQLDTVAEGVETKEQLEFLISHGCMVAQGFLFGLPITGDEVLPLLEDINDETARIATAMLPATPSTA